MRILDIIMEATTDNVTVFYGGRFQPMHKGHYALYSKLVNKFGKDNVFIASTFSKEAQTQHAAGNFSKNPFTFDEKKSIMAKMFNIPASNIVQTNPYRPDVTLTGRSPDKTAVVLVFSEKDAGRLKSGGYLAPLPDSTRGLQTVSDERAYYLAMPIEQGGMSATDFRETMTGDDEDKKKQSFQEFFGKYDDHIFKFIEDRLNG